MLQSRVAARAADAQRYAAHAVTMTFAITCRGTRDFVEISREEFDQAKLAKRNLFRVLAIEDKFDLVLANYTEFERELLDLALQQMVYFDDSWSSGHFDIYRVNRRLANLLSAAKLYTDQVKHDAATLDSAEVSLAQLLDQRFSSEYDAKLGYRVMEALRNYTQHRSLPVHQLDYPSSWEPQDVPTSLVFRVVPNVSVAELREDDKVKAAVLADLKAIGELVPLTPLVRDYLEGLSAVHEEFRALTAQDVANWEAILHRIQDRGARQLEGNKNFLILAQLDESGHSFDEDVIFEEFMNHRKELVRKNTSLARLSARFVSGACDLRRT